MSILRLAFSIGLFLAYGGVAIYLNSYIHSVNSEAVEMFFVLQNRAIYVTSVGIYLKEGIETGDKALISHNTS